MFIMIVSAVRVGIAVERAEPIRGETTFAASLALLSPVIALRMRESDG